MKKNIIIWFCFLFTSVIIAQNTDSIQSDSKDFKKAQTKNQNNSQSSDITKEIKVNSESQVSKNLKKVIKTKEQNNLQSLNHTGEIKINSDSQSIFEFLFPSLIALLIGAMAYFSTVMATKKQLISNEKIIKQQIESALKIAELDFRKTVLSENRQAWINELRNLMSELLTSIEIFSVAPDHIQDEKYIRLVTLITKAEFMLNPTKDSDFINSIIDLKQVVFDVVEEKIEFDDAKEKIELVKNRTKETLKREWERVKKGE